MIYTVTDPKNALAWNYVIAQVYNNWQHTAATFEKSNNYVLEAAKINEGAN